MFLIVLPDMALFAAEMASYLYDEDQDPAGAFEWWASPCGWSDLVPEDIRRVFDIINGSPWRSAKYTNPKILNEGPARRAIRGTREVLPVREVLTRPLLPLPEQGQRLVQYQPLSRQFGKERTVTQWKYSHAIPTRKHILTKTS